MLIDITFISIRYQCHPAQISRYRDENVTWLDSSSNTLSSYWRSNTLHLG